MTKTFTSKDRLIPVPDAEWAKVSHGDCIPLEGEVLIADLLRLRDAANARNGFDGEWGWQLWQSNDGSWHAHGPVLGTGFAWWSEKVTYRGD